MQIQTIENRIKEIKSLLKNGGTEEAGINTTLEYIDKIYIQEYGDNQLKEIF